MSPLELAALNAEAEAASLRADALNAMTLEAEAAVLYDAATDALDAYERARERARLARQLAGQATGAYNPWGDT